MLASGSIFGEENDAFSSRTSTPTETGFNLRYSDDRIGDHAIAERIIDRLRLFEAPDSSQSSRYNVELDLENEDSDWSFEITVTVGF